MENVKKSISRDVITLGKVLSYARKTRDYKLSYLLMSKVKKKSAKKLDGNVDQKPRETFENIEKYTKKMKTHRNPLDMDNSFIWRDWTKG